MFDFGWCSDMGIGGWLLMISFWGGFLSLVVWAVVRLFPAGPEPSSSHAVDVLGQRFAGGEIDADADRESHEALTGPRA